MVCGLVLALGSAAAESPNPRQQTEALIDKIEAQGPLAEVAQEPLERAKKILAEAAEARANKKPEEAQLLEDFALEWAQTGVDLVAAHQLEREAAKLEREATAIETDLRRTRALLEETETRRGRARAEVQRLDPDAEVDWVPLPPASAAPSAQTPLTNEAPAAPSTSATAPGATP